MLFLEQAEGEMPRYKHTDAEDGQGMFLSVNLKEQLLPGSFEHMPDELIGGEIGVSVFDGNYKNDETGATAIPPATLLNPLFRINKIPCRSCTSQDKI
jgi:hypothetical protein